MNLGWKRDLGGGARDETVDVFLRSSDAGWHGCMGSAIDLEMEMVFDGGWDWLGKKSVLALAWHWIMDRICWWDGDKWTKE